MMSTVVAATLSALCLVLVLRPLTSTRPPPQAVPEDGPESERSRELLRQLRDLDEDHSTGKLDDDDHRQLRLPVERQVAQVLRRVESLRTEQRRAQKKRAMTERLANKPAVNKPAADKQVADKPMADKPAADKPIADKRPDGALSSEGSPGHRRRVLWFALPAGAVALAGVAVLLSGSLAARTPGQTITGAAPVSAPQSLNPTPAPNATARPPSGAQPPSGATPPSGAQPPSAAQIATVDAAVGKVTRNPKDVEAHLDLAQAYADAGTPQLSAVEYLAVTQLDPGNGTANTELATIAFAAGQTAQAEKLVDTALHAHPGYPEALYVRGLIGLMGLRDPVAAERDLKAYLAAAPNGSHRASVETLLAIASGPSK
jgi:Flp pilus assembly protein TadD